MYQLSAEDVESLKFAIENSQPSIKIDLKNTSSQERDLFTVFRDDNITRAEVSADCPSNMGRLQRDSRGDVT